jgi:hypothetical protein
MKRLLSHILLFPLLVISPFSFTTPEIPSVYISVTINAPVTALRKNSITVAHRVGKLLSLAVVVPSTDHCIIALPILPAIDSNLEIEHGRSPPVLPASV